MLTGSVQICLRKVYVPVNVEKHTKSIFSLKCIHLRPGWKIYIIVYTTQCIQNTFRGEIDLYSAFFYIGCNEKKSKSYVISNSKIPSTLFPFSFNELALSFLLKILSKVEWNTLPFTGCFQHSIQSLSRHLYPKRLKSGAGNNKA